MKIVLEGTQMAFQRGQPGKPIRTEFDSDVKEIKIYPWLLVKIDLTPVGQFTKLKTLYISSYLQEIDLSPLAVCQELESLLLKRNQLLSIDLSPLSQCKNFKHLNLTDNPLLKIDLNPLADCKLLANLDLRKCRLSSIDLSPLTNCRFLKHLDLRDNNLTTIDLTPLQNCENLESLNLKRNKFHFINLAPLAQNSNLDYLYIDKKTIILWENPNLSVTNLAEGLFKYRERIKNGWKIYLKGLKQLNE